MKDGKSFEAQVADFYRAILSESSGSLVTQNERISGPDGDREFDIVVRTPIADFTVTTVIECKDYARLVNVTTVDGFASKLEDIRANKGILVARKGFTRSALEKAKRLKITACTLDMATRLPKDSSLNIPVLFRKIEFSAMSITFKPQTSGFGSSMRVDMNSLVCDTGLMDIVKAIDPNLIIKNQAVEVNLSDFWSGRELWCRNQDGDRVGLSYCKLSFELKSPIYFGFLGELPSSMFKRDEIKSESSLLLDVKDFLSVDRVLRSYRQFNEVPDYAKHFFLTAVVCPERIESVGEIFMFARKTES